MLAKTWFKKNQSLLLWMANTSYGRDLLCIDKDYPKITTLGTNYLKCKLGKKSFYDFRTHDKWAKVIRTRQKEFQFLSRYFEREVPVISYARNYDQLQLVATSYGPFYPDANPESSTVDGFIYNNSDGAQTWAGQRGYAGSNAFDSDATINHARIQSGVLSTQFAGNSRTFALFDTSSIDDAETVTAATLSYYGVAKFDNSSAPALVVIITNPASNTALAPTDYANVTLTRLNTTDITYAGFSTSGYNDLALNSTGLAQISKTGITKLGTASDKDVDNVTPTVTGTFADTYMQSSAADQSGTSQDPKLVVTAEIPSSGIPRMMGGIGM